MKKRTSGLLRNVFAVGSWTALSREHESKSDAVIFENFHPPVRYL